MYRSRPLFLDKLYMNVMKKIKKKKYRYAHFSENLFSFDLIIILYTYNVYISYNLINRSF